MGGFMSRDIKHIHLHNWSNPHVTPTSVSVSLRLIPTGLEHGDSSQVSLAIANDADQLQRCLLARAIPKDAHQKALILRINYTYIHNEFGKDIELEIRGLFPPQKHRDEETTHPDYTGRVKIFCPATTYCMPRGIDRLLYRPRLLLDEVLETYAGLEDAILGNRTIAIPEGSTNVELFDESDPLVEFVWTRREALAFDKNDIKVVEGAQGKRYYQLSPSFLAHIRAVFRDKVFDEFRYTRFEETRLHVDLPRSIQEDLWNRYHTTKQPLPNLVVVIEFVYLLVTPGEKKLKHKEVKLN
jgi:hypothetical protein